MRRLTIRDYSLLASPGYGRYLGVQFRMQMDKSGHSCIWRFKPPEHLFEFLYAASSMPELRCVGMASGRRPPSAQHRCDGAVGFSLHPPHDVPIPDTVTLWAAARDPRRRPGAFRQRRRGLRGGCSISNAGVDERNILAGIADASPKTVPPRPAPGPTVPAWARRATPFRGHQTIVVVESKPATTRSRTATISSWAHSWSNQANVQRRTLSGHHAEWKGEIPQPT